jgi:hypothetical protein
MHRCGSGLLITALAITFILALTGCLGKSSGNPGGSGVASVILSPAQTISLNVGTTQVFSAFARDASGRTIVGVTPQFVVTSGSPDGSVPLSVATNGNGCAGTWDQNIGMCSPGTPGIAYVTAVVEGVSSPRTEVYVHQKIDSIQISRLDPQGPPLYPGCFSQGQIWYYQANAYSNKVDITDTIGPITWSSSNPGVVTATPYVPPNQPLVLNQVQATAAIPGITQLSATVSGATSAPYPYTTCLIQSILLQIGAQGQAGNQITVNSGSGVTLTATAYDTLHLLTNNPPLKNPPLTWITSNPEVAAFSSITNSSGTNTATARANLGGATLSASCTPPSCNIGVQPGLPIYASDGQLQNGTAGYGAISVDVTSTSPPPTYTAWAATTDCEDQAGCNSALFSVTPGTTPISSILGVPRTPNSMRFNLTTQRLYIGSDQGLMYVDLGSGSPSVTEVSSSQTPCNVSICGRVLAISSDGKKVAVADTVSVPGQVYIYDGSSTGAPPVDLILSNSGETATVAAFSPDQLKLFFVTTAGNLYVYPLDTTVGKLRSLPIAGSATDVKFSADGSFAYIAGTPANAVSAYSTCSLPAVPTLEIGSAATTAAPLEIFPSPVVTADPSGLTQEILVLEPPYVATLTAADFTQVPIPYADPLQLTCDPPTIHTFTQAANPPDLGQGSFTPIYAQLVNDGAQMIVVGKGIHAVLVFDVANGRTSSVTLNDPLGGTSDPLAAEASTDGSQVYVAACDQYSGTTCTAGSVHIVNTCGVLSCSMPPPLPLGDFQQVPYANINQDNNPNMCNGLGVGAALCLPNMIVIQPK